jgi:hypothetical protein
MKQRNSGGHVLAVQAVLVAKRKKVLPKSTLCAATVDPRMKKLRGVGPIERAKIWTEVAS